MMHRCANPIGNVCATVQMDIGCWGRPIFLDGPRLVTAYLLTYFLIQGRKMENQALGGTVGVGVGVTGFTSGSIVVEVNSSKYIGPAVEADRPIEGPSRI